ncbi:MAG: Asp23/Gls24 family envelope stress response protein [Chloroflexi bacterium]|nr:Asp23/Gls24 family envelope stress response protein [Chloroflexota bacterium]
MSEETRLGRIEVSPLAIATIASRAVLGCYGVVGMASNSLRNGLEQLLGQENSRRGVQVKLVKDQIVIDLYVVLEHGLRVSEVAQNIMESVKFNVEKSLGIPVAQVNIHVQGLRISTND